MVSLPLETVQGRSFKDFTRDQPSTADSKIGFQALEQEQSMDHNSATILSAPDTNILKHAFDANSTKTERRTIDIQCNPPQTPVLVNGPALCGFPTFELQRDAGHAVLNAFQLAAAGARAATSCDPPHPSLNRYFDIETPGVREKAIKVLGAIFGPNGLGPSEFPAPGLEFELWWDGSVPASRQFPGESDCNKYLLTAYTANSDNPSYPITWIVTCSQLYTRKVLEDIECDGIGDVASRDMLNMGAIILHELTHWNRVIQRYARIKITGWNSPGTNPPNGYEP